MALKTSGHSWKVWEVANATAWSWGRGRRLLPTFLYFVSSDHVVCESKSAQLLDFGRLPPASPIWRFGLISKLRFFETNMYILVQSLVTQIPWFFSPRCEVADVPLDDHQYLQDQRHCHAFSMVTSVDCCANHCILFSSSVKGIYWCILTVFSWSRVQLIHFAHHSRSFHRFQTPFFGSTLLDWDKNYFLAIPQAGLGPVEIPIWLATVVYASWGSDPAGFGLSLWSLCAVSSPLKPPCSDRVSVQNRETGMNTRL